MNIMIKLTGKNALITGSSRGVGQQIAMGLAKLGCNIIVHGRTQKSCAKTLELLKKYNVNVYCVYGELSEESQVNHLIDQVKNLKISIDILYNNAAVMTPYHENWLEAIPSEYELSFRVNTIAPILLSNYFLPMMISQKWGRIVNITSGIKDQPELMAYAASKAALDKYVFDMAPKLVGSGVTMNLIDPGWLRTDLGGPNAPNSVESVLPGALVTVLATDGKSGQFLHAQDYFKG